MVTRLKRKYGNRRKEMTWKAAFYRHPLCDCNGIRV